MNVKTILKKTSSTKVGKQTRCGYSVSTIWIFDGIENKHDLQRDEDCMKKFSESLIEHAMKITNFENKKMITSTNKQ